MCSIVSAFTHHCPQAPEYSDFGLLEDLKECCGLWAMDTLEDLASALCPFLSDTQKNKL